MKKILYILILLLFFYNAYSQNYDLIVTTTGDSISCRIDSITNTEIYFEMKVNNNWFHTYTNKNDIIEYKLNAIDKKLVIFKSGTSYIVSSREHKNVLYATAGIFFLYYGVNVNYERMIRESNDRFIQSLWIRVGAGVITDWSDDEGINLITTITALTGKRNSHFEFALGATHQGEYILIFPAGNLGYRYQKPKGGFVFRTGIGWPETIYLSFGYSF